MRTGIRRAPIGHYARQVAVASLLAAAGVACAAGPNVERLPVRTHAEALLLFDNATSDPVRVYLVDGGSEWLIGHVQPGHSPLLRLPIPVESLRARELSLLVVPLASGSAVRPLSVPRADAIRSEPVTGASVTTFRWRLAGKWLTAYPLPAGR